MSHYLATSLAGDHTAVDSCIDFRTSQEFELYLRECQMSNERRRAKMGNGKSQQPRELPPPVPPLPWIMKRYHTRDGRLIIWREKMAHCEYLRAHRSDGRLTLQLVSLDDAENIGQENDISSSCHLVRRRC